MDDLRLNPLSFTPQFKPQSFEEVLNGTGVNSEGSPGGTAGWINAPKGKRKSNDSEDEQYSTREKEEDRYENPDEENGSSYKTDLRQDRRKAGSHLRLAHEDGQSEATLDKDEWQAFHTHQLQIEILTPGQLPGPHSLWLNQYMDHAAHQLGTAGLIRVGDGALEIEVYHGDSRHRPEALRDLLSEPAIIKADWDTEEAQAEIHRILKKLYSAVPVWSLYGKSIEQIFPKLDAWSPTWTMLTGADQDAALYTYRQIKTLVLDAEDLGRAEPKFQVMFLGCAVKDANEAATRLHRAASTFLDTPIEWAGYRQRMAPLRRTQILSAESEAHQLNQVLEAFLNEATAQAQVDAEALMQADAPIEQEVPVLSAVGAPEIQNAANNPDLPAEPEIVINSPKLSSSVQSSPVQEHSYATTQPASKPSLPHIAGPGVTSGKDAEYGTPGASAIDLDALEESLNTETYDAPDFSQPVQGTRKKRSNAIPNATAFTKAAPPSLNPETIDTPNSFQTQELATDNAEPEVISHHHSPDAPQQASLSESALIHESTAHAHATFSETPATPAVRNSIQSPEHMTASAPQVQPDHLHFAFLHGRALSLSIPRQPQVQCISDQGSLRLAMYADEQQLNASQATQVLLSAGIWARDQSDLIQSACPEISLAPKHSLKLDLFLAQPAEAMRWLSLMQQSGLNIQLHLLKEIQAPGSRESFWLYESLS